MLIRRARAEDAEDVQKLYEATFDVSEASLVADLAVALLQEPSEPETLSLVAEIDGNLVAHVAFSPVYLAESERVQGFILAPLGVHPDVQKGGLGTRLVKDGLGQLSEAGIGLVMVYGDPQYYGRFGFDVELAKSYPAPYPLAFPEGWQALSLNQGTGMATGALTCVSALSNPVLW